MPGNTETPTNDRNTKFPEELDAAIYAINNVLGITLGITYKKSNKIRKKE